MTYKTGQVPQVKDEVMGEVDGKPARGRVLAVRESGKVLVTRRAPYAGPDKPLASEHVEVASDGLSLVYRPIGAGPAPVPGRDAAAKAANPRTKSATKDKKKP